MGRNSDIGKPFANIQILGTLTLTRTLMITLMHGKSFKGRTQVSLNCHLPPPSTEGSRVGGATAFDVQGLGD